jgi:glutamate carboxypeptidase
VNLAVNQSAIIRGVKPAHLLIISLLFPFIAQAQTANLTPTEQKMVQIIDGDKQKSIDLLRQLVEINSGTKNLEGVREVGKVLMPRFEALGSKCAGSQ